MAIKLDKILKGGHANVFSLEGANNYVLVMAFADKGFVVPLLHTGRGYTAYISASYSEVEYDNIEEFMKVFNTVWKSLPKFSRCFRGAPSTAFSKVITGYVSGVVSKAKTEYMEKYLVAEGYDVSALYKTLITTSKERDYSDLMKKPEAQQAFEAVAEKLRQSGARMDTLDSQTLMIYHKIKNGSCGGCILSGPTGVGKSVGVQVISHEMKAPLLSYQCTDGTQIEDMKGEFIPSEDKDKGFEYCLGLLLKAYSEGYQMLLDEGNMAPQPVLSFVNQIVDDTPSITINGKIYKKHPNFVLYITMNPGYAGTYPLNIALKNRFPIVQIKPLTINLFTARLTDFIRIRYPMVTPNVDFIKEIFNFQNYVQPLGAVHGENIAFSIRNAKDLLDSIYQKSLTLEEFTDACCISYLNYLSLDNDNTEALEAEKNNTDTVTHIKQLYDLYDFRKIEIVDVVDNYDDCFDNKVPDTSTLDDSREVHDFDDDSDDDILDGFLGGKDFDWDSLATEDEETGKDASTEESTEDVEDTEETEEDDE